MPDAPSLPDDLVEVDARGLNCPLPVIELAKALRDAPVGTHARLLATDTTTKVDVPVWCRMQRQRLHTSEQATTEDGQIEFSYVVEKVSA